MTVPAVSPPPAWQPRISDWRPWAGLCLLLSLLLAPMCLADAPPLAADLVTENQPIEFDQDKFRQLFAELTDRHQFSPQELERIFQGLTINRRVLVLADKQWEAKPYYRYAPLFVTRDNIANGRKKLEQYKELLDRIETVYGVDREVVVAIWGLESRYGTRQGSFEVLRSLTTLFDAYPRRATFFRRQLIDFLLLCRESGRDPRSIKGSYAGAFGQTQFIPTTFLSYAVSFDGDATRDIWDSIPDVLASIANYLKQSRWTFKAPIFADLGYTLNDPQLVAAEQLGRRMRVPIALVRASQKLNLPDPPENRPVTIVGLELEPGGLYTKRYIAGYPNFQAITEWNHSNRYAMAVTELAAAYSH